MNEFDRPVEGVRNLTPSFRQRLNSYALSAGAAGVSVLALAQPSEARIIYTRTHHVIGNGDSYKLDFNLDGIAELTFQNKFVQTCSTSCSSYEMLVAKLARHNQVVYNAEYGAVAMKAGMRVGPKYAFQGGLQNMADVGILGPSSAWGSWINVDNRYLGVKFKIKGETHYGWARLSVQVQALKITATLTGYAYESLPNKPIVAGKTKSDVGDPTSNANTANPPKSGGSASHAGLTTNPAKPARLGLLALGARGIPLWRSSSASR